MGCGASVAVPPADDAAPGKVDAAPGKVAAAAVAPIASEPSNAELIAQLVATAAEDDPPPMDDDDEEEAPAPPPPPLNEEREALVKQLYDACDAGDGTTGDGIQLDKLKVASVSYGTGTTYPLGELKEMDLSKDGVVTLDEMRSYFQLTGQEITDQAFAAVVTALIDGIGLKAA